MQYNLISADNHILEPRDLFTTRLHTQFRDAAPREVRGHVGMTGSAELQFKFAVTGKGAASVFHCQGHLGPPSDF